MSRGVTHGCEARSETDVSSTGRYNLGIETGTKSLATARHWPPGPRVHPQHC